MRILYVSDLDGTLLGDDQQLSPTSLAIINDLVAQGMLFTVATGRSLPTTDSVLRGLDLRQPIICMNGALVVDPLTGRTVRHTGLDSIRAEAVVRDQMARGLHPIVFTIDANGDHHVYHLGIFNECEERYINGRQGLRSRRFRLVDDFAHAVTEAVMSVAVIDLHDRVASAYAAPTGPGIYRVLSVDDHHPTYSWLETLHADANKGAAVRFVKEHLEADRVVCFGDQANDLPMFAAADESFVVADAHETFRAAATGAIGSNKDDAVARYLRDAWASGQLVI